MKKLILAFYFAIGITTVSVAQQSKTANYRIPQKHKYTAYERLILKNVSTFHKNFNKHEFEKNGPLVADSLKVNSNGALLEGRDAFVKRIARFTGPFPDVRINDKITIIDGNMAVIKFVLTGTQDGDFETPSGVIHPTHKKIMVDGFEQFTFDKDGKMIDLITIERLDQLLQQLKGN